MLALSQEKNGQRAHWQCLSASVEVMIMKIVIVVIVIVLVKVVVIVVVIVVILIATVTATATATSATATAATVPSACDFCFDNICKHTQTCISVVHSGSRLRQALASVPD